MNQINKSSKMKKIILSVFIAFLTTVAYSQEYNVSQRNLIKGIADFLKNERYNPEKQDDGLKFTKNGVAYYIEVSHTDTAPMYLRLRRYFKYNSEISPEYVSEHLNSYNVKYGVKTLCSEKAVILSAEMYLTETEEFISIFEVLMSQLESASRFF